MNNFVIPGVDVILVMPENVMDDFEATIREHTENLARTYRINRVQVFKDNWENCVIRCNTPSKFPKLLLIPSGVIIPISTLTKIMRDQVLLAYYNVTPTTEGYKYFLSKIISEFAEIQERTEAIYS